eukprot:CAMPEP_0119114622 /NCGR_PEP_ID=MMETSP1180-20130426/48048_1 /TAXON_ID=3052 ORGANISM="Chlamydomonas cf sp, Strain CCMP681" /NCGR_SAMPLE_ID=MMETSP1180 /ASSEMBLY_ACC=CAM_ASM_000741 /LENGTH=73 /DNA_ID=CAMNT_0007103251 /DNA_START=650 /DNA_END=871 /DNA_ORIENTATION=+
MSSMGSGSVRQPPSKSQPAPSKNTPFTYTPSFGGDKISFSSRLIMENSKDRVSMGTLFLRAVVCNTAVRKPVG